MTPILRAEQMCPLFELRFYDKQKKRKLNKFDWKKVIFEKHFLVNGFLHFCLFPCGNRINITLLFEKYIIFLSYGARARLFTKDKVKKN